MAKKAALHNLGCKVNEYELEAMAALLKDAGYTIVPFAPGADVYIINTCTVTNIADRKSRQMLHKAKKMNPEAVICAVGCYAQMKNEELQKDPSIDLILGSNKKSSIVEELSAFYASGRRQISVDDLKNEKRIETLSHGREGGHSRSFVRIQDGCNQFCTYCIIPYARGRIRSRSIEDILLEIHHLAGEGCREVVLTGIHIGSFGKDLPENENLPALIQQIAAVEGIERIRLGSLEPRTLNETFLKEISGIPKVCPHFHLSLQSGCDRTLRRMNRHYSAEEFAQMIQMLRRYYPDPALTTDVIVGFPGETEEDFEESRAFIERMHFYETHIFPYSRREGTPAAGYPMQLPEKIKKERSAILQAIDRRRRREYIEKYLDKPVEVLTERRVRKGPQMLWSGLTKNYIRVLFASEKDLSDQLVLVKPKILFEREVLGEKA